MFESGFNHTNPHHANVLLVISTLLTGIAASLGCFFICRKIGMNRPYTFLTTGLVLGCSLFSAGVSRGGAPTMLFNSMAFLAICAGASGMPVPAILIAALAASFHPVTGGLALAFVCFTDLMHTWETADANPTRQLLRRGQRLAVWSVLACLPLAWMILTRPSAPPTDFSINEFFSYIANKTSVPLPLHDGLSAAILFAVACLVAVMNLRTARRILGESLITSALKTLVYFIALCWIGQVIIAEVLRIPALTPLGLNFRMAPIHRNVLYLSFAILAFSTGHHTNRPAALLLFPLCFAIQVGIEFGKPLLNPMAGLSHPVVEHAMSTAMIILPSIYLHSFTNGKNAIVLALFGIGALLLQLAIAAIATNLIIAAGNPNGDISLSSTISEVGKGTTSLICYALVVVGFTYAMRLIPSHLLLKAPALLCWAQITILVYLMPEQMLTPNFRLSKPDQVAADTRRLISEHVQPNETIFTVIGDINGIRRQYFDWKHEFFVIYAQDHFPHLIERLKAARVDFDRTVAGQAFEGWRWLFVPRFHMKFNWVSRLIWADWRAKWYEMKVVEPSMSKVLLPSEDVQQGDIVIGANSSGYSIVIPNVAVDRP
jgi:hypothetical protein